MNVTSWVVQQAGSPMVLADRVETPGAGEVVVEVAGCGVCHTDLGFYFDGVPTRHPFPLTLGHEISGRVVEAGPGAEHWMGQAVVVPAVIPCGGCPACLAGRGAICPKQVFPGSDVHGGFASAVRVPAAGLCAVPDLGSTVRNPAGVDLVALSVVADAVSTPYQAAIRAELSSGDLAVFVGVGGIGGFGVQIARALGATVVAIDINQERLDRMMLYGASVTLNAGSMDQKTLRKQVKACADAHGIASWRTKIFETSGTPTGQMAAFGLLSHGARLAVVGYTPKPVEVRLSNLMAFDAIAQGNWGCVPELYPEVVELVLSGRVALEPFVERRPLSSINDVFAEMHAGGAQRRIILVPGS
ncbi:MAG: 6-hydroxycyclohex-1-ene-1-carbonyl-CoA dehydrogenase [Acidobacteriota bacterium]